MNLHREKTIGLVVIVIAFFCIVSATNVKASFLKDFFSSENDESEKSIFDISGLDSDSDGLSDEKEYDLGTNPYAGDSDEDGYSDAEEVKMGYDPLRQEGNNLVDADNDGLTGEDERRYNTNPNKADTDYDGYPDGFEVLAGHNPLEADFSFIDPLVSKATEDTAGEDSRECEGDDCNIASEDSNAVTYDAAGTTVDTSTSDSIEKLLNVENFSEVSSESLTSVGLDSSRLDFSKDINIVEVENSEIKVLDNSSQEFMQIYFNVIGIILYSNSPVRSMDEAESYASSINISNPTQVSEMKSIVSNIREELEETEVPNTEEFINFHKKVVGAAHTLENLMSSLGNVDASSSNSFYDLMNLLPKFSGYNDFVFDDIYPEAQSLAERNGVQLPTRSFLEEHE